MAHLMICKAPASGISLVTVSSSSSSRCCSSHPHQVSSPKVFEGYILLVEIQKVTSIIRVLKTYPPLRLSCLDQQPNTQWLLPMSDPELKVARCSPPPRPLPLLEEYLDLHSLLPNTWADVCTCCRRREKGLGGGVVGRTKCSDVVSLHPQLHPFKYHFPSDCSFVGPQFYTSPSLTGAPFPPSLVPSSLVRSLRAQAPSSSSSFKSGTSGSPIGAFVDSNSLHTPPGSRVTFFRLLHFPNCWLADEHDRLRDLVIRECLHRQRCEIMQFKVIEQQEESTLQTSSSVFSNKSTTPTSSHSFLDSRPSSSEEGELHLRCELLGGEAPTREVGKRETEAAAQFFMRITACENLAVYAQPHEIRPPSLAPPKQSVCLLPPTLPPLLHLPLGAVCLVESSTPVTCPDGSLWLRLLPPACGWFCMSGNIIPTAEALDMVPRVATASCIPLRAAPRLTLDAGWYVTVRKRGVSLRNAPSIDARPISPSVGKIGAAPAQSRLNRGDVVYGFGVVHFDDDLTGVTSSYILTEADGPNQQPRGAASSKRTRSQNYYYGGESRGPDGFSFCPLSIYNPNTKKSSAVLVVVSESEALAQALT